MVLFIINLDLIFIRSIKRLFQQYDLYRYEVLL